MDHHFPLGTGCQCHQGAPQTSTKLPAFCTTALPGPLLAPGQPSSPWGPAKPLHNSALSLGCHVDSFSRLPGTPRAPRSRSCASGAQREPQNAATLVGDPFSLPSHRSSSLKSSILCLRGTSPLPWPPQRPGRVACLSGPLPKAQEPCGSRRPGRLGGLGLCLRSGRPTLRPPQRPPPHRSCPDCRVQGLPIGCMFPCVLVTPPKSGGVLKARSSVHERRARAPPGLQPLS